MNSLRLCWLILVIGLLITGCYDPSLVDISDTKAFPPDAPIVFGRVKAISDGKPIDWGGVYVFPHFKRFFVSMLPEGSSTQEDYELSGEGFFYWHLRPNSYTITAFQYVSLSLIGTPAGTRSGRIYAQFTVPKGRSVIYIGTLTLNFVGNRYNMLIEDDYDKALQRLRSTLGEITGEVTKSLMQLEKPL